MTTPPPSPSGPGHPRTSSEFAQFFPDEAACERYLERLRWPHGFACPKCGRAEPPWQTARGPLCRGCRSRISITAGTVLEGTRKPLCFWVSAAWEMAARPTGVSARRIQEVLGLGSYQTAWAWQHKLRRAMAPSDAALEGRLALGRITLPGTRAGRRQKKTYVGTLIELVGKRRIGRVRLGILANRGRGALQEFGHRHAAAGTVVVSAREGSFALRRVDSLLHRWLLETYQGAISIDHLDHYLDEFTFRFNGRKAASRGVRFRTLLEHALNTTPVTTRELFQAEQ